MDRFACLKTKEGIINYDFILSDPGNHLSRLEGPLELIPYLSKPVDGPISIKHFEILKKIGEGGFSRVFLVRKIDTGRISALKIVDKNQLIDHNKDEYLFNERTIWKDLSHPNIVIFPSTCYTSY